MYLITATFVMLDLFVYSHDILWNVTPSYNISLNGYQLLVLGVGET